MSLGPVLAFSTLVHCFVAVNCIHIVTWFFRSIVLPFFCDITWKIW